jgi:ABC-2 type transport system ATP-binding protein
MPENDYAVELKGMTKDFALGMGPVKLRAVENLSLQIRDNEIYGLLGPNGSGKSTTLKVLLGLLAPTQGSCEIYGRPSTDVRSRESVGFLPEAPYFYRFLSGYELVRFYAKVCQVNKSEREDRVRDVIDLVGMTDAAHRRVGTYSKGMLQRIGLAQALVHDPRLVILDEPTAGVDPIGSAAIADIIMELKRRGKTVLLCSHLLAQVEGVCDRIAIMNKGKLVTEGKVKDLLVKESESYIKLDHLSPEQEKRALQALKEANIPVLSVEHGRIRLDELFLNQVTGKNQTGKINQVAEDVL